MRLAVLVLALVSLTALTYSLLTGSLLGVGSVTVTGTTVLTDDQVREAAAVPIGRSMLGLDPAAVAGRVAALAPVAQVRVERSWPSAVLLHVTERVPVAFEPTGTGARLIDGGGLFFATVPAPPPGLPELHAIEGPPARAAAMVITALGDPNHEALRAQLIAVSAESPADVRLRLRGDRTVRWGGVADSDRKAMVLAVLLSQPGQIYDVASPDLPTIR
jgi:cell division protein FtsQ